MKYTTNYNLKKPDATDFYDVQNDNDNADILDGKLKELENNKVDKVTGKQLSTNDYTTTEKNKLAGIEAGAEVNDPAFKNVKVGTTTIVADTDADTLEFVAGSNVTITPDATNDKLTISATDTTYSVATTSANGLMSSTDKSKLDGIATGANKTTLSTSVSSTSTTTAATSSAVKSAYDLASTNSNNLATLNTTVTEHLADFEMSQAYTDDLNNIDKNSLVYATTSTNKPNTIDSFYVQSFVRPSLKDTHRKQIAFQATANSGNSGDLYIREMLNGTWSNWMKLISIADLSSSINSASTTTPANSNAVKIAYDLANSALRSLGTQSGAQDLNNFTTNGIYYFTNSTSQLNTPPNVNMRYFILTVEVGVSGYLKQTIKSVEDINLRSFERSMRVGSTWSEWKEINTSFLGVGSPEGIVTAPVGSFYINTNGGVSTTLYIKTAGTGNTGWTAK